MSDCKCLLGSRVDSDELSRSPSGLEGLGSSVGEEAWGEERKEDGFWGGSFPGGDNRRRKIGSGKKECALQRTQKNNSKCVIMQQPQVILQQPGELQQPGVLQRPGALVQAPAQQNRTQAFAQVPVPAPPGTVKTVDRMSNGVIICKASWA